MRWGGPVGVGLGAELLPVRPRRGLVGAVELEEHVRCLVPEPVGRQELRREARIEEQELAPLVDQQHPVGERLLVRQRVPVEVLELAPEAVDERLVGGVQLRQVVGAGRQHAVVALELRDERLDVPDHAVFGQHRVESRPVVPRADPHASAERAVAEPLDLATQRVARRAVLLGEGVGQDPPASVPVEVAPQVDAVGGLLEAATPGTRQGVGGEPAVALGLDDVLAGEASQGLAGRVGADVHRLHRGAERPEPGSPAAGQDQVPEDGQQQGTGGGRVAHGWLPWPHSDV